MVMEFAEAPRVSMARVAMKRGAWKGRIPRIEARAARVGGDPRGYAAVCGYAPGRWWPVTFPDVVTRGLQLAVLTAPEFPLPLLGIVHARQVIVQSRPIRGDEAMTARAWVEGHRVVRRGGEFDLHCAIAIGGEEAWHGVTTILSRAIPGDGQKRVPPQGPTWAAERSTAWRIASDIGRRYAQVSGDWNPIHLYGWSARLLGFPRPIAHGWWLLARALAEMDDEVGDACRVEARFAGIVPLGSEVLFASGAAADGTRRFGVEGKRGVAVDGWVGDPG